MFTTNEQCKYLFFELKIYRTEIVVCLSMVCYDKLESNAKRLLAMVYNTFFYDKTLNDRA